MKTSSFFFKTVLDMRKNYKIDFDKKHLIIKDGKNVILVDTGSPITIHKSNSLEFAGTTYSTSTSAIGNTIEGLQSMSGVGFTTLMGLDILSNYNIILDYANEEAVFMSLDEPIPAGTQIPMQIMMGAIIIPVSVAGSEHRMILDTGATYSYIKAAITADLTPVDTITDFSPLVGGEFTTPIFEIESAIEEVKFTCCYGNLPSTIEMMIRLMGVDGVIGYDLLASSKLMICAQDSSLLILHS